MGTHHRAGQGGGGKEAVASVGGGVTHVLCGFWAGNVTGMQWSGSGAWCGRLLVVCHCVPGAVCGTGACAGQDVSLVYWICSCLWLYAECVWRRSGGPSCAMYEYLWTGGQRAAHDILLTQQQTKIGHFPNKRNRMSKCKIINYTTTGRGAHTRQLRLLSELLEGRR